MMEQKPDSTTPYDPDDDQDTEPPNTAPPGQAPNDPEPTREAHGE